MATPATSFEKVLNFRDIALSVNPQTNNHPNLQSGLFFRSGVPDNATLKDRQILLKTYNLKTIIDLRTDSEQIDALRKHKRDNAPSSAPLAEPSNPAKPFEVPGITYKYINLNGHAYSGALIKQLSYWNTAKLYGLYIAGYRSQAISILGENVMAKRGLVGLAEDSLKHCTSEVKTIFDSLSERQNYPVLVHCTQGKDRTGLTVLLVLLLLKVPIEAIEQDYQLSEGELASEREERLPQIRRIGLPDEFAGCAPGWATKIAAWIDEEYGGIESYLHQCEVEKEQQNRVISILKESADR